MGLTCLSQTRCSFLARGLRDLNAVVDAGGAAGLCEACGDSLMLNYIGPAGEGRDASLHADLKAISSDF